jgi:hypothetical protein
MDETNRLIQEEGIFKKVIATSMPPSMDETKVLARKIISTLTGGRRLTSGTWIGQLPPPRISPPPTFGSCPIVKGTQGSSSHRRADPDQRSKVEDTSKFEFG